MKQAVLSGVYALAATLLLSSCFYLPDPVSTRHELFMRWPDGQQVKVDQTIELKPESLNQASEGSTNLVGFEVENFDPSSTNLGSGVSLHLEYREPEKVLERVGFISRAVVSTGESTIELYDGSGEVDNFDVVIAHDHIAWAELSDGDSAATFNWSIKSVPLAGGEPKTLAIKSEFEGLTDSEASLQFLNLKVVEGMVFWSPSTTNSEGEDLHQLLAVPVDGSAPAYRVSEHVRLVQSSGTAVVAQLQEPSVISPPSDFKNGDIVDVGRSVSERLFEVDNNAELLASVQGFLTFKSRESYFLADLENKQFSEIVGLGAAHVNVTACDDSFVFNSITEEHDQLTYVIDTDGLQVSGEISSSGVRCANP